MGNYGDKGLKKVSLPSTFVELRSDLSFIIHDLARSVLNVNQIY